MPKKLGSIDKYISAFPRNVQNVLQQIRKAVKEAAPEALESTSYSMITTKLNGNLVWFGAFKDKKGDYDVRMGLFFSLDKPIPLDLIKEVVKFRAEEILQAKD